MAEIDNKQIARLASLIHVLQELVADLRGQNGALPADRAERIKQFRVAARCLYCESAINAGEKTTRGCHAGCYGLLRRRVEAGELTWQQVIKNGWVNPIAEKPGRKPSRPDPMRDTALAEPGPVADDLEKHEVDIQPRRDKGRDKRKPRKAKDK